MNIKLVVLNDTNISVVFTQITEIFDIIVEFHEHEHDSDLLIVD